MWSVTFAIIAIVAIVIVVVIITVLSKELIIIIIIINIIIIVILRFTLALSMEFQEQGNEEKDRRLNWVIVRNYNVCSHWPSSG